ncbi:IS4 family transposase [Peribacillus acanthi]|uniref:IS4 family transposase n=1 Tax=Peribacillus acanthi TaxID=2171554 RepID=UPI000D3E0D7E|nr:IS4 family transposase [Peribacillus acanthi]
MLQHSLTSEDNFQLISEELTRIFSSNFLDDIARKELFVQRTTKLKPKDFVALCSVWNQDSGKKSLAQLCGILDSNQNVSLTTEGLNQRFNEAGVRLLKKVFHILMGKQFLSHHIPNFHDIDFYRIRILDSTGFELPCQYLGNYRGYHKSGVKIQLEYELLKGEFIHLEVQNGRDSDATFGPSLINTIQANDLIIRDLGYFSLDELVQIHDRDAYYITRLKPKLLLFTRENHHYTKIDLEEVMEDMEIGEVREIEDIYVSQAKKHIPRLILCKLTDEQTEQRLIRRNRQEKKKGVKYSHHTKKLTRLNIFISNIPYQCIPKEDIQTFYSLRWQVEILFKTWKSLFKIHEVKKMKMERFECHLYGTLISLLITSTLAFQIRESLYRKKKKEISEFKAISIALEYIPILQKTLISGEYLVSDTIRGHIDKYVRVECTL